MSNFIHPRRVQSGKEQQQHGRGTNVIQSPVQPVRMDYQSFSDIPDTTTTTRRVMSDPLSTTTTTTTTAVTSTGGNSSSDGNYNNNNNNNMNENSNLNRNTDTAAAVIRIHTTEPATATNGTNTNNTTNDASFSRNRGFGTSINDMFANAQQERIDCCSITLCGILQHDRDRYLMNHIYPPSFCKRFLVHVVIPLCIFLAAGIGAMRIENVALNELISITLVSLFISYLLLQCSKGRHKRIDIRKDILFTKYKIQQQNLLSNNNPDGSDTDNSQQPYYGASVQSSTTTTAIYPRRSNTATIAVLLEQERPRRDPTHQEPIYYLGQTKRDMACAHPCCMMGCYPVDDYNHTKETTTTDIDTNGTSNHKNNICHCMYEYICPSFCGSYIQCCGMCAIAQEGRDIETFILPPPYRRIDYITMEAVMKYYPAIYQYRHPGTTTTTFNNNDPEAIDSIGTDATTPTSSSRNPPPRYGLLGHPLSRLSYRLMQSLLLFCFVMILWSQFGKYYYSYILGRHSYQKHQYQLIDFCLMISLFGQSFFMLYIWAFFINRIKSSELSLDAIIKYFASGFFLSASLALFWEMLAMGVMKTFISLLLAIFGIDRMASPQTDHIWSKPFGSNSLLLTSISSSPTIVSQLYGSAEVNRTDYATVFGMDHPFLYSLYILIVTFFVAGFIEELCKYFGYRMVEHPDFFTCDELEEASMILRTRQDNDINGDDEDVDDDAHSGPSRIEQIEGGSSRQPSIVNFSKQRQSVQGRGAAITLAMVSVAIGFACCENLIYVFHYASESVIMELGVLLERSCFPIHPVFAAIQSIGVCQRELEGTRSMRLGRVILPAVIFHGTFDFLIIFIGFVGRLVGQDEDEGDLRVTNTAEFLSIVSCVIVMTSSFLYLYNESGKQRERLAAIDLEATVDRSSLI